MTAPEIALHLRGIEKRFGAVQANAGIDLDVRPGEIHCLLGENGAGKSTLISMLAGQQRPDAGEIVVGGRAVRFTSPTDSRRARIGVVFQHSMLIPTMTVHENMLLAAMPGLRLHRQAAEDRLTELSSVFGEPINPARLVAELSLGERQQLELVRALWAEPRILVLDEPTSMLTPAGAAALFQRLQDLAKTGVAVILVTHKIDEALALGDRITVLRSGEVAARFGPSELAEVPPAELRSRILDRMFGGTAPKRASGPPPRQFEDRAAGRPLLALERVTTSDRHGGMPIFDVSLQVHAGEVVGIAGIDGHGQRALAEAIAGSRGIAGGRVIFDGRDVGGMPIRRKQRLGLRYVTDDRLGEGIVGQLSVALNLLLKRIGQPPFWRLGSMNRAEVEHEAQELIRRFDIRTPSARTPAGHLSGGNVQKILLARELAHDARLVVLNKPSYGLDAATVSRVHGEVRRFVSRGGACLMLSTDLDELLEIADRIAVLAQGRIVGWVLARSSDAAARVSELMTAGGQQ